MPFKSEAQRRFLWAKHPDIAQRWSDKYGSKPVARKLKKDEKKAVAKRRLAKKASEKMSKNMPGMSAAEHKKMMGGY